MRQSKRRLPGRFHDRIVWMSGAVALLFVLACIDARLPHVELAPIVSIPLLVFAYFSSLRQALMVAALVAWTFAYIEYGPWSAAGSRGESLGLNAIVMALGYCSVVVAATRLQREMSDRTALQGSLDSMLIDERLAHVHARTDPLSGLLNRRGFEEETERLGALCTAGDCALVVLFVDLDGLKAINDTHGHPIGDAAIRSAARRIRSSVRSDDVVARVGGDEFVVICTGTRAADASMLRAVDDVRDAFRRPMQHGGVEISLSASIGSATSRTDGPDIQELLRLADARMYEDKSRSRSDAVR